MIGGFPLQDRHVRRRRRSIRIISEVLEPRYLLSGDVAHILATIPDVNSNINIDFDESAEAGNKLFFTGHRDLDPERLWVANDSNAEATALFSATTHAGDGLGVTALTNYHDQLYFFGNSSSGDGLFRSDGTASGTVLVKLLRDPNTSNVLPLVTFGLNDRFYFFWNDLNQPTKLYSSDGTAAGTNVVWTAPGGISVSSVSDAIGGRVFFGASGQLWCTDGTAAGTAALWTDSTGNTPSAFAVANDKLFFLSSGYRLRRLYTTDLDGAKVTKLNIPWGESSEPGVDFNELAVIGSKVLFDSTTTQSATRRLFSTDGTDAGTVQLAGGIYGNYSNDLSAPAVASATRAIFVQNSQDSRYVGIFSTDGTVEGTTRLINHRFDLFSIPLVSTAGRAFGIDRSTVAGIRMYESDGTVSGTRPLQYLAPPASDFMHYVTTFQDRLIVETSDGIPVLWSLDPNMSTGSIGGGAFSDSNRNGTREGFEGNVSGKAFIDVNDNDLLDRGELWGSTDNGANYLFDGLPPAHYDVRFAPSSTSLTITAPPGGTYGIDLAAGQTIGDANFTVTDQSTVVWGYIFNDANGNQVRDADEAGIGSQTVFLDYDGNGYPNGAEPSRLTAADGSYGFVAAASGDSFVRRTPAIGWSQTTPPGFAGAAVSVSTGSVVQAAPFGLIATPPGAVIGWVWNDRNADGVRDSGDTPLYGAYVYLDANGDAKWNPGELSAYSDINGRYAFNAVIPGLYTVSMETEMQALQTSPPNGNGYSISVQSAHTTRVPDFLTNWYYSPKPAGQITGHVWSDHNGDGVETSDEPPAWGLTVWLDTDNDGICDPEERQAITDANGDFAFPNSAAGTYRVRLLLPDGWTQTAPLTIPTTIALADGQQYVAPDFGAHSSDTTPPSVVSKAYRTDRPAPEIDMQLSEDVLGTISADDLQIIDPATQEVLTYAPSTLSYDAQSHNARFVLPLELPNDNYRAVLPAGAVSDVAGNPLPSDESCDFYILHGDGDGNRVVNLQDFNLLATNFGKTGMSYSQGNYDYSADGRVSLTDFNVLATNFGKSMPLPAPMQVTFTQITSTIDAGRGRRPLASAHQSSIASQILDDRDNDLLHSTFSL